MQCICERIGAVAQPRPQALLGEKKEPGTHRLRMRQNCFRQPKIPGLTEAWNSMLAKLWKRQPHPQALFPGDEASSVPSSMATTKSKHSLITKLYLQLHMRISIILQTFKIKKPWQFSHFETIRGGWTCVTNPHVILLSLANQRINFWQVAPFAPALFSNSQSLALES